MIRVFLDGEMVAEFSYAEDFLRWRDEHEPYLQPGDIRVNGARIYSFDQLQTQPRPPIFG